jgi:hypothetical protein
MIITDMVIADMIITDMVITDMIFTDVVIPIGPLWVSLPAPPPQLPASRVAPAMTTSVTPWRSPASLYAHRSVSSRHVRNSPLAVFVVWPLSSGYALHSPASHPRGQWFRMRRFGGSAHSPAHRHRSPRTAAVIRTSAKTLLSGTIFAPTPLPAAFYDSLSLSPAWARKHTHHHHHPLPHPHQGHQHLVLLAPRRPVPRPRPPARGAVHAAERVHLHLFDHCLTTV